MSSSACSNLSQAKFAGDNFLRSSGDAPEVQKLQLFAWQAAARGNDVHLNANPTQGELLHSEYKKRKEELKDTTKVSILAKYGGEQYLQAAPQELRQGQTENYVEYSRSGQVIKGRERAKARSKYPEDGVYIVNIHFHSNAGQFTSTTTRLSGVHGTILDQAPGVTPVAIRLSISRTAQDGQVLMQHLPPLRKPYSLPHHIRTTRHRYKKRKRKKRKRREMSARTFPRIVLEMVKWNWTSQDWTRHYGRKGSGRRVFMTRTTARERRRKAWRVAATMSPRRNLVRSS